MDPEEFKKYKSKFIDYLADVQSKEYKVIPCVENMSHSNSMTMEYAFIFSIKCGSDRVLIVHENVNPDRSTLLFYVREEGFMGTLRSIYDILQSSETNKRSSLRSKDIDIDKSKITMYKSLNHDDSYSWKASIQRYLRQ